MDMFKDLIQPHGFAKPSKLSPSKASGLPGLMASKHGGADFMMARKPSIASFASVMRQSNSVASILALAEEPTRASHPTKFIENNTLRVPASLDQNLLCPEMLQWAKSPRSGELNSSARLIQSAGAGGNTAKLAVDSEERMLARQGDEPFIFLQVTDLVCFNVPQNCEVFYVVNVNEMTYASRPWSITEKPTRNNEAFLLPFSNNLKVNLFVRFPVVPSKKKGFMNNLRKKNSADHLQGAEVHLGEVSMDLVAADFGKEAVTLRLNPDRRLETTLKWNFDASPELTVNMGIWTGAVLRVRSQREAAFASYLTIQTNPKCPTWKRYWAVTNPEEGSLQLFDFEYKGAKLHHTVPLAGVLFVKAADPEEYPIANAFQMICPGGSLRDSREMNGDWAASTDTLVSVEASGWVCRADSPADMAKWIESLSSTVRLARSRAAVLPKRIVQ